MTFTLSTYKTNMQNSIDALHKEFVGLRTGRASTNLIDPITVEAYGSRMPMSQVGTVNAPDARLLTVQVWDKGMVKAVEKSIREAGLGLNPTVDGQIVRIPIPDLTEERRKDLAKVAAKFAESTRIAVRNVRRDAMDGLKNLEKEKEISEDDHRRHNKEVQELTDEFVKTIDEMLSKKDADIMQV